MTEISPVPDLDTCRIAVIGLGYVGLPLAVEFGKRFDTLGFDVDAARIAARASSAVSPRRRGCA